jgi:hypothetical protein
MGGGPVVIVCNSVGGLAGLEASIARCGGYEALVDRKPSTGRFQVHACQPLPITVGGQAEQAAISQGLPRLLGL